MPGPLYRYWCYEERCTCLKLISLTYSMYLVVWSDMYILVVTLAVRIMIARFGKSCIQNSSMNLVLSQISHIQGIDTVYTMQTMQFNLHAWSFSIGIGSYEERSTCLKLISLTYSMYLVVWRDM